MRNPVQNMCVLPTDTLRRVLEVLQASPLRICIVWDEHQKILGTITDGDCRRAFLNKLNFESPASEVMNRQFLVVDTSFSMHQMELLMRTNDIKQVPIVDRENVLVDIVCAAALRVPSQRENAALILAGGKGKRLAPLTNYVPKPMLPVGGKPMIENLIVQLVRAGVLRIFISINYLGYQIEEHFGDGSKWGCRIEYLKEDQELGTAGPLRLLSGKVQQPLLVVNGDLVTSVDFGACFDFHRAHSFEMSVGVSTYSVQIPFGVVTTGEDGRILSVAEKPEQEFTVNAGLYIVEPTLLDEIPADCATPMTDVIERLVHAGRSVGAFPIHESWVDVGRPEQYMNAQKLAPQ
jgi:dTDP-glucose pyrophosphorylase/predicted transcriptional regulator